MFGIRLSNIRIYGGQIKVVGLDAVVAEFTQATLERRGDDGSAGPIWSLRAVLSYQNDFFLASETFAKIVVLEVFKDKFYEARDYRSSSMKIDGDQILMEELILCPIEPKS